MENPHSILKKVFGYDSFRPGQEEIVSRLLAGQDVLAVMPTGAGKSLCYQVPALLLPGLTLVISPLISLMKDQVMALRNAGIPAGCINSSMSLDELRETYRDARYGAYKLLYVAPERLLTAGFCSLAEERADPRRSVCAWSGCGSRCWPSTRRTASRSGGRISGPAI